MLDRSGDGVLHRNELWTVINRFRCTNIKFKIQSLECLKIIECMDTKNDKVLDPREFSTFVARLALTTGLGLEELTALLMEEIKKDSSPSNASWHGIRFFLASVDTALAEESMETMRSIERRKSDRARSA